MRCGNGSDALQGHVAKPKPWAPAVSVMGAGDGTGQAWGGWPAGKRSAAASAEGAA